MRHEDFFVVTIDELRCRSSVNVVGELDPFPLSKVCHLLMMIIQCITLNIIILPDLEDPSLKKIAAYFSHH